MPSGERSQTWYPSVVALLGTSWGSNMNWDAIISLRDALQGELEHYRKQRGIVPAVLRCRQCGELGPGAPPQISVRAMLIAVRRFGIAPEHDVRRMERDWAHYRAERGLDLYGHEQGRNAIARRAVQLGR